MELVNDEHAEQKYANSRVENLLNFVTAEGPGVHFLIQAFLSAGGCLTGITAISVHSVHSFTIVLPDDDVALSCL